MFRTRVATVALLLTLVLVGCGKERGRVPFSGTGTGEKEMVLEAGEVDFWTDIDVEYEGDAVLAYRVQLLQGGNAVASTSCHPLVRLRVRVGWVETNFGSAHSRSGSGRMACSVELATGGPTRVKATLEFSREPAKLRLTKADLVVKQ
jgi:hypothetical protein